MFHWLQKKSARAAEILSTSVTQAQYQPVRNRFNQADADSEGVIDASNMPVIQSADVVGQPSLINRADLLQQNQGRTFQAADGLHIVMGGEFRFYAHFAGNRCNDDGGAVFVAYVVLDNDDGAVALLFRADPTAQISIIQVAAQICVIHILFDLPCDS